MNKILWTQIEAFDLDFPVSEYGFSTRLARENFWTKKFTNTAILEYKKFMYLAATSDLMVSPSEVIDKVWHQHLIFTQSYQDFCHILGKSIQHVPSTHNKVEFARFHQAKERTVTMYTDIFGDQPQDVWGYRGMFESLELEKARLKIRTIIIISLCALALLVMPAYFALRPLYLKIGNPMFMVTYMAIATGAFIFLEIHNTRQLKRLLAGVNAASFLWKLDPFEIIYLKTGKISDVINGHFNGLLKTKSVKIDEKNFRIEVVNSTVTSIEGHQIMEAFAVFEKKTPYPPLLRLLSHKPIFSNTANCMDAFMKYFRKSKEFSKLFYVNLGIFGLLFLMGFVRLTTGIERGKPVEILIIFLFVLGFLLILALKRLANRVFSEMIPEYYFNSIIGKNEMNFFEWQYVRQGSTVLDPSFIPVVGNVEKTKGSVSSSTCGTSCGSSCGSSCSSCGGCGGD